VPINGSREGLFNAALALLPESKNGKQPIALMPNPFYQVYSVGTIMAQAEPMFVSAGPETDFLPDYAALPPETLDRVAIAFICSPSNPQGGVATTDYWKTLLKLAEKHDFVVFADECYSEIYRDTPPKGALEVAKEINLDPERLVAFHSLSKDLVDEIMGDVPDYQPANAGFFLWLPVWDGEAMALKIWKRTGVRVLPGAYLSRPTETGDPGAGYVRVALVADINETRKGLEAIRACM